MAIISNIRPLEINDVPKIERATPVKNKTPKVVTIEKNPTYLYSALYGTGVRNPRGYFLSSEYNLSEIGRIEDVESMVAQSFIKKIGLMFKQGYALVSHNPKTLKYIEERFAQIEQVSGISSEAFIRQLGESFIKKSNSFAIKVRREESSGGKARKKGKTDLLPVAAYFPAPSETMRYNLDADGKKVIRWEHKIADVPNPIEFNPDDVVHFKYACKDGFVFGTPTLTPAIADIEALRRIEENVELLIYQHLFPLFHYKVGTDAQPATVNEFGQDEIELFKKEIKFMPSEGGIVTSHRHTIEVVGANARALQAKEYLDYFKQRVISGLGISAVDLGESDTSNKSTSDNMSRNLIDTVKDFQREFENKFNTFIIKELLLESDFADINPLDKENMVYLRFNEIDIDAKIKWEAHLTDQFDKQALTYDELRILGGKDIIEVPTAKENDSEVDLGTKYPMWYKTQWKLFGERRLLLASVDEPYTSYSKSGYTTTTIPTSGPESKTSSPSPQERGTPGVEKTDRPPSVKQQLKQFSSLNVLTDGLVEKKFSQVEEAILGTIKSVSSLRSPWVYAQIHLAFSQIEKELLTEITGYFYNGFIKSNASKIYFENAKVKRMPFLRTHIRATLGRLEDDLSVLLKKIDSIDNLKAVFDSIRYRANFIDRTEFYRAYNVGFQVGCEVQGIEKLGIESNLDCDICASKHKTEVKTNITNVLALAPFHPLCQCSLYKI